jgi:hypothetical protein
MSTLPDIGLSSEPAALKHRRTTMFLGSVFVSFTRAWSGWNRAPTSSRHDIEGLPYWLRDDVGLEEDETAIRQERRKLADWTRHFRAFVR